MRVEVNGARCGERDAAGQGRCVCRRVEGTRKGAGWHRRCTRGDIATLPPLKGLVGERVKVVVGR